jgi:hypothetical protein
MQQLDPSQLGSVRSDWTLAEAEAVHALPFNDLLFHAQRVHRLHFEPNKVQISTLLSIKTGGCPEDCAYCPQSVRYETGLAREPLNSVHAGQRQMSRAFRIVPPGLLTGCKSCDAITDVSCYLSPFLYSPGARFPFDLCSQRANQNAKDESPREALSDRS